MTPLIIILIAAFAAGFTTGCFLLSTVLILIVKQQARVTEIDRLNDIDNRLRQAVKASRN